MDVDSTSIVLMLHPGRQASEQSVSGTCHSKKRFEGKQPTVVIVVGQEGSRYASKQVCM